MFEVHAGGTRLIELNYSVFLVTDKKNSSMSRYSINLPAFAVKFHFATAKPWILTL